MPNRKDHPFRELPHILFQFLQMSTIGALVTTFLVTYLTFDDHLYQELTDRWYGVSGIIFLTGLPLTLLYLLFLRMNRSSYQEYGPLASENARWYVLIPLLSGLIFILGYFQIKADAIGLILVICTFLILSRLAQRLSIDAPYQAWRHPTTAGGIIEGTASLGLVTAIGYFTEPDIQTTLSRILLMVLLLEILTLWARLRFLSRAHPDTRKTLQMILGSHLILFAVRLIFGLVMPVVYMIWTLFISSVLPYHPVVLMIIVGEFSDRILFFVTVSRSLPAATSYKSQI